jgi:leukotriene-A4 hydrolase
LRHFDIMQGNIDLKNSIALFGENHKATQLYINYQDELIDPDDYFSSIPYEKGFQFLFYLENVVGNENFEKFLSSWLQTFKYKVS